MQLGKDFIKALKQIEVEKGLPVEIIASSLEAAMVSAYKKYKNGNQEVNVHLSPGSGEISLAEKYLIVEAVENPDAEWTIDEAKSNGHDGLEIGDYAYVEVNPENFGRIAAQTARQVIIQRLKDAERQIIFNEFADHIGDLVTGTIFKAEGDQILVRVNDRTDALLPKEERISGEACPPGERRKFLLLDVRKTTRGPRIVVSRTHPGLLKKLMELEVPEIAEGTVEIRSIVREAGTRAKIAVASLDANVDPVGACVGTAGARIKSISEELGGERIDVIVWNGDPMQFVRNALSPAKVAKIEPVLEQEHSLRVYVRQDQLSLAIGKAGQNVRLAARLTGWKIDIKVIEPERLPTMQDLFEDIIKVSGESLWEDLPKN
ncbi:MAG: transcription termination factor NusA [Synergistaceae bacterium]|jgi:N utilization substance protein A|nr:transcription termination factor NusA [Synergistaceae bacterium]